MIYLPTPSSIPGRPTITALAPTFSPDGSTMLTGYCGEVERQFHNFVVLWDLTGATPRIALTVPTLGVVPSSAVFSADGRSVWVHAWGPERLDLATGERTEVLVRPSFTDPLYPVQLSADGGRLAFRSAWGRFGICRVAGDTELEIELEFVPKRLVQLVPEFAMAPDWSFGATIQRSRRTILRAWDVTTGAHVSQLQLPDLAEPELTFDAAGHAVVGGDVLRVCALERRKWRIVAERQVDPEGVPGGPFVRHHFLRATDGSTVIVARGSDREWAVSGGRGPVPLSLWADETTRWGSFRLPNMDVRSMAWSSARMLAVQGSDGEIALCKAQS